MVKITDLINFENYTYNWDAILEVPEFARLQSCEQSPKWHGEGNAWNHTKCVCEHAIKIASSLKDKSDYDAKLLLTAALFHDIGKGVTTHQGKDGRWHAIGHEIEGEKITRLLLWNEEAKFREAICSLVRWHMVPLDILERKNALGSIVDLSRLIPSWNLLILVKMCDVKGSTPEDSTVTDNSVRRLMSLITVTNDLNCLSSPAPYSLKGTYNLKEFEEGKTCIDVIVPIGLPGSGKSTFVEKTFGNVESCSIISRDTIRVEFGFCKEGEKVVCSSDQESIVTEEFNKRALDAAKKGHMIVLDNINLKKKYRDAYKSLFSDYRVIWRYIYFEAPSLEDNIKRREGQIDESVFTNMILNFDWPTYPEYEYLSTIISNETAA